MLAVLPRTMRLPTLETLLEESLRYMKSLRRVPMVRRVLWHISAVVAFVAMSGCGEDAAPVSTITGSVTLDGKPVTVGVVQFINEELGVGANAYLDDDGRYHIDTPFLTGRYGAAILPPPPPDPIMGGPPPKGPFILPEKFASFETSGLSADLVEGRNTIDFALSNP
jgi:hypothetical protein